MFLLGGVFFFLLTLAWELVSRDGHKIPYRTMTAIAMTGWAVMIFNVLVIRVFDLRGNHMARSIFYMIGNMSVPLIMQMMRSMTSQKLNWKLPLLCEIPFAILLAVSVISRKHDICNNIAICYSGALVVYSVCATFIKVRRFNIQLRNSYSDDERRDLRWIANVAWMIAIFVVLYAIFQVNSSPVTRSLFSLSTFVVWGTIYWNVSRQKPVDTEMLEETDIEPDDKEIVVNSEPESPEVAVSPTTSRRDDQISAALYDCMVSKKAYLDPEITIKSLATMIGTNTTYMSAHLNEKEGKNFSAYINEFRLDYAEELLKTDPGMGLEEIATKSGFSSMQTFHRLFKARNGCTPRQFTGNNKES